MKDKYHKNDKDKMTQIVLQFQKNRTKCRTHKNKNDKRIT